MEDVRIPRALVAAAVAVPLLLAALCCGLYVFRALDAFRVRGELGGADLFVLLRPVVTDFVWAGVLCVWLARRGWHRQLLTGTVVCLFLGVQIAQYLAVENATAFLTGELLAMASLAFYALSGEAYLMLAAAAAVAAATCIGLVRLGRHPAWTWRARLAATLALLVPLGIAWLPRGADRIERLEAQHGLTAASPVLALAGALGELGGRSHAAGPQEEEEAGAAEGFGELHLAEAERHGISLRPKHELPFVKEHVYEQPLPFARTAEVEQPNLVLLMVESLSAAVLSPYGARADVTPNIGRFAQGALRVDDYLNHTAPTVAGVRGQLCSSYPAVGHGRWKSDEKPATGSMLCMAHVLRDAGYDTLYLTHSPRDEYFMADQVRELGFARGMFADDVLGDLLGGERPRGWHGNQPDDVQMFRALDRLVRSERLREPFFVTASTVGTHTGQDTRKDGPYHRFDNRVRNVFFRMDASFGAFWDGFSNTERARRTIVVLTGDHAMFANDALRKAAGPRFRDNSFDYMGLLIRDPVHELPATLSARTTSIDLAPSLLQLLGAPNVRNPFLGRSMFSDRPAGSHGHGLIRGRKLLYWKDGQPHDIRRQDCETREYPCAMFPLLRFSLQMAEADRLWAP
ncbi:MAG: sulfatase-like hydrolase/transferase [Rhodobacteraceae bacterium]|nr:sulfatase-like hydrolase/transferase [Paracoccaceae bacterium]